MEPLYRRWILLYTSHGAFIQEMNSTRRSILCDDLERRFWMERERVIGRAQSVSLCSWISHRVWQTNLKISSTPCLRIPNRLLYKGSLTQCMQQAGDVLYLTKFLRKVSLFGRIPLIFYAKSNFVTAYPCALFSLQIVASLQRSWKLDESKSLIH